MGIINLLSEEVSQLISAGEVVERPLSVVKELVENAIDAKANRIEIKIRNGGKSYISVKDNGSGMDREDLEKCLNKYATSKIFSKDDLYNIITLGFRGEALYSISAVSKIKIQTRCADDLTGWFLYAYGGEIKEIREGSSEKGTLIEVEELFHNIPARKKFLKSDGWERQLIVKFIEEISLLYPEITFILNSDEKDLLVLHSVSDVGKRIINLFPELINNILFQKEEKGALSCSVYLSKPDIYMPEFYVYSVNKRVVREKIINRVIKDTFDKQQKKPSFLFLDLSLPPYEIDVNVHPSKKEIKFRDNERIYSFLRDVIEEALKEKDSVLIKKDSIDRDLNRKDVFFIKENFKNYEITAEGPFFNQEQIFQKEERLEDSFRIIGIFAKCFILIEKGDDLLIMDQHALHERLIYNKLLENEKARNASKKLLLPYIFNVTESLRIFLEEKKKDFENIGFLYEEIGPKTFALTDVPSVLDYDGAVFAFSELIKDEELIRTRKDISKELIAISACKSAVKKGDNLDINEIKKVMKDYLDNKSEGFCPHGRPFISKITLSDMEKLFGRKK